MLDRLFALRYHDAKLYLRQAVGVAAGLSGQHAHCTWYLIRADSPNDAFDHQRRLLAGAKGHSATGHCACPVETLGQGELQDVLRLAAAAGVTVTPVRVPDLRVSISRTPRWNEILTEGSWLAPMPAKPISAS